MSSPFLKQVFNKDKTFRPKRKFEPGTQRFELHKRAQASLNAGLDLRLAVQLPPGEELNDWVAVHVVDFFNRINLIYGTISDGCTEQSCPVMSGGPKYEYRWQDEHRFRKPTALSAPRHAVPQELPAGGAEDPVAPVPRLRARVHPPLRPHRADGLRGPRQHLLQALLLLCHRVRPHRHQGAGAAERHDRTDVPLRAWATTSLRGLQEGIFESMASVPAAEHPEGFAPHGGWPGQPGHVLSLASVSSVKRRLNLDTGILFLSNRGNPLCLWTLSSCQVAGLPLPPPPGPSQNCPQARPAPLWPSGLSQPGPGGRPAPSQPLPASEPPAFPRGDDRARPALCGPFCAQAPARARPRVLVLRGPGLSAAGLGVLPLKVFWEGHQGLNPGGVTRAVTLSRPRPALC
ncbi:MOB kinase activator 3A isoform X1 [Ictidomys tridecemlineatus]